MMLKSRGREVCEEKGFVNDCMREQHVALRAIRSAIDSYFLDENSSCEALDGLMARVGALCSYVQSVSNVIGLRNGVDEVLSDGEVKDIDSQKQKVSQESFVAFDAGELGEGKEKKEELTRGEPQMPLGSAVANVGRNGIENKGVVKSVVEQYAQSEHTENATDVSIRRKQIKSLEKEMTLNDRLYFRQTLCGGDTDRFKELMSLMDGAGSFYEGITRLSEYLGDETEVKSESVKRFVKLLEQRYGSQD